MKEEGSIRYCGKPGLAEVDSCRQSSAEKRAFWQLAVEAGGKRTHSLQVLRAGSTQRVAVVMPTAHRATVLPGRFSAGRLGRCHDCSGIT